MADNFHLMGAVGGELLPEKSLKFSFNVYARIK
jgi:hypothetical protein